MSFDVVGSLQPILPLYLLQSASGRRMNMSCVFRPRQTQVEQQALVAYVVCEGIHNMDIMKSVGL